MNMSHRQRVRKAMKSGLTAQLRADEQHVEDHVRLIHSSFKRRKRRGENMPTDVGIDIVRPYIRSGWCQLYQALSGGEVVSSMTVARSSQAAYLHTSGTSVDGMACGAAHFLVHEISKRLRAEGVTVFNLGGAPTLDSGLAQFKQSFGAESVPLQAAEFMPGSRYRTQANRAKVGLEFCSRWIIAKGWS
jgi:hypothetical protein